MTPRRHRLTLGSLMIVVAVCALILFPYSRTVRELERIKQGRLRAVHEAKIARVLGRKTKAEALVTWQTAHVQAGVASVDHRSGGHVWAALSVDQPIIRQGEAANLEITFNLVNETNRGIDPRIQESRIVVNGEKLAESSLIMGRTPRTLRFQRLPSGQGLHFVAALGRAFEEPGIYRVVWEGSGFRSPEVVIRVLPKSHDDF